MRQFYKIRSWLLNVFGYKTLGVRAIITRNQDILLIEHTYLSRWYLPGGGVERSESPLTALRRELIEEVGIMVQDTPLLLGAYYNRREGRDDYTLLYHVSLFTQQNTLSPEIKQAKWFAIMFPNFTLTFGKKIMLNRSRNFKLLNLKGALHHN